MIEHYFPPTYGSVECDKCERVKRCPAAHSADRARRELTSKQGRCPRLPDAYGEVDLEESILYQQLFPLVRARNINFKDNAIRVEIHLPGERRWRRLHWDAVNWHWYFCERQPGRLLRRTVHIEGNIAAPELIGMMRYSKERQFRAEVRSYGP